MKIKNFLDTIGLSEDILMPVSVHRNAKGTKETFPPKNWQDMTKIFKNYDSKNSIGLRTGEGLYVIDIDTHIIPDKYTDWVASLGNPTVITAKGTHYYVKSDVPMPNHSNIFKDESFKVDIRGRGGFVYVDYSGKQNTISYSRKGDYIEDKNFKIFKSLPLHVREPNSKKEKATSPALEFASDQDPLSLEKVQKGVDLLDIYKYSDEMEWKQMIQSIYHANPNAKDIAVKWSKGDAKEWDESVFNTFWARCESGTGLPQIDRAKFLSAAFPKKEEDTFKDATKQKKREGDEIGLEDITDVYTFLKQYVAVDVDDIHRYPLHDNYGRKPLLYNQSLSLHYGVPGGGKSHNAAVLMAEADKTHKIYIDFEMNGSTLKSLCEDNDITYVYGDASINTLMMLEDTQIDLSDTLITLDSFSRIVGQGFDFKDPTHSSNIFGRLRMLCVERGATIIVIDHATGQARDDDGKVIPALAKIEGSESGKEKNADIVLKIIPNSIGEHEKGITAEVMKSRVEEIRRGDRIAVGEWNEFTDENIDVNNDQRQKEMDMRKFVAKHRENIELIKIAIDTMYERPNGLANRDTIRIETGLGLTIVTLTLSKMKYYGMVKVHMKKMKMSKKKSLTLKVVRGSTNVSKKIDAFGAAKC